MALFFIKLHLIINDALLQSNIFIHRRQNIPNAGVFPLFQTIDSPGCIVSKASSSSRTCANTRNAIGRLHDKPINNRGLGGLRKKRPSISGNILLYKSEPKVRRVATEAEAAAAAATESGGGIEKRDTPQETNRASAAAARVSPATMEKGARQFTSPISFFCKVIREEIIH